MILLFGIQSTVFHLLLLHHIDRLESEQRQLEEHAMRQNAVKMTSIDKNQQEDRFIAEAKQDKLRYLEEQHSAQRKVSDLQTHLKILESKLAEKDTQIRLLQEKKSKFPFFPRFSRTLSFRNHF